MKKIFITTIIICNFFSVSAQTAEETKEFIKLKSRALDLHTNIKNYWSKKPQIIKYNLYNFSFYDKYLIIERDNMLESGPNNGWEVNSTDYICIELKRVKSIDFEKSQFDDEQLKGDILINNNTKEFPYIFENQKNNLLVSGFLNSKNKEKYKYTSELPIRINVQKYDEETFNKFRKAFKHLVGLYGGKIIDDLF
jgi:hypothetical protein